MNVVEEERKGFPRDAKPTCLSCHHPISFHGGGQTRCRALGCDCEAWLDAAQAEETHTLTSAEVAAILGRGRTWVKDHAEMLGGVKYDRTWWFSEPKVREFLEEREGPA